MFGIGPTELMVILILALIVFGPKRLPEIGRTLGKSLREVRRASMEIREQFETDDDDWSAPSGDSPSTATPASSQSVSSNGRGDGQGEADPGAQVGRASS